MVGSFSMIGRTLGHYRIEELLCRGGMGEVYRARDTRLDRTVAVKLLGEDLLTDPAARARLVHEARTASSLNHPHICTIYEVGEADGQAYIAMEYVEGRSLSDLEGGEGLPAQVVMAYGAQIADALTHAHENGVIHRDLKSSNVLVTSESRAKVLDFGLAKRLRSPELSESTVSKLSITGEEGIAGTLHYMAPEVLRGEPADACSDVWGLGGLLYEATTGRRPFEGRTAFELTSAILRDPPAPLPSGTPAGLRIIIHRCLEKNPRKRYPGAREVRAALDIMLSEAAILPAALRLIVRRWHVALSSAVGVAVVVLLLLSLTTGETLRKGVSDFPQTTEDLQWGLTTELMKGVDYLRQAVGSPPPVSPQAEEAYLRGRYYWNKTTEAGVRTGIEYFQQAIAEAPDYAPAYAGLADSYIVLGSLGALPPREAYPMAREAAGRALEIDDALAEGHASLASIHLLYDWNWRAAEDEYKQALLLNPEYATAHQGYAVFLAAAGRLEEALREARRARELDPRSLTINTQVGFLLYLTRRYESAVEQYQATLEIDPTYLVARAELGTAFAQDRNFEQAIAEAEQAKNQPDENPFALARLGSAYALSGNRAKAEKVIDELGELSKARYVCPSYLARIYIGLGDKDRAIEWLEKAYEERSTDLVWLRVEPGFDALRSDPRFQDLLRRMNFPE